MDTKEIYLKKIDEFIEKYKDESKIASINTYLKGNAKIIYGLPMKRFKALFGKYINEFANLNNDDLFNIINSLFLSLAFEKQVAACMLLENNVEKLNIDLPNLFQEYIENNIIINWAVADQTALNILSKLNNLSSSYKKDGFVIKGTAGALIDKEKLKVKDIHADFDVKSGKEFTDYLVRKEHSDLISSSLAEGKITFEDPYYVTKFKMQNGDVTLNGVPFKADADDEE